MNRRPLHFSGASVAALERLLAVAARSDDRAVRAAVRDLIDTRKAAS